MSYVEKEKLIKADLASIENRVRHAFNQGYELGRKESKTADLSELIDKIEGTTWYHIANGKLVEGANGNDAPLYKANEILGIIHKFESKLFRG